MPYFMAELETTEAPSNSRRKPKLVIKGRRRSIIRKLLATLESAMHQDDLELVRSQKGEYSPMLLRGNDNSLEDRAIKRIIGRCQECLAAKA